MSGKLTYIQPELNAKPVFGSALLLILHNNEPFSKCHHSRCSVLHYLVKNYYYYTRLTAAIPGQPE